MGDEAASPADEPSLVAVGADLDGRTADKLAEVMADESFDCLIGIGFEQSEILIQLKHSRLGCMATAVFSFMPADRLAGQTVTHLRLKWSGKVDVLPSGKQSETKSGAAFEPFLNQRLFLSKKPLHP